MDDHEGDVLLGTAAVNDLTPLTSTLVRLPSAGLHRRRLRPLAQSPW
jgi:hypothetical protein